MPYHTLWSIFNEIRKESYGAILEFPEQLPDGSERYRITMLLADVDQRQVWKEYVQFRINPRDDHSIEFEGAKKKFKVWQENEIMEAVREWIKERIEKKGMSE